MGRMGFILHVTTSLLSILSGAMDFRLIILTLLLVFTYE